MHWGREGGREGKEGGREGGKGRREGGALENYAQREGRREGTNWFVLGEDNDDITNTERIIRQNIIYRQIEHVN